MDGLPIGENDSSDTDVADEKSKDQNDGYTGLGWTSWF